MEEGQEIVLTEAMVEASMEVRGEEDGDAAELAAEVGSDFILLWPLASPPPLRSSGNPNLWRARVI